MNNSVLTFQTLHPDTIMGALFERGIRVDSGLTPFNSYGNRVYQFQDEGRQRLVVKFYRPEYWTADQVLEGHQFVLQLVNDEVSATAPVAFSDQTLLDHQGFYFTVSPNVGDRQFGTDNIDQMEAVGRYLGCMHQTKCKQFFIYHPTIGLNEYPTEPYKLFGDATLIPSGLGTAFLKATDELTATVAAHWRGDFTVPRLHGDCHVGSILQRNGPMFVDLGDACNGPAVQDLWMLLNDDKAERQMQLETIIGAHEEFSEFDTVRIRPIEPLRAMCSVYYLAWLARCWVDPAFPKNFLWLAGEGCWLRQTVTFIEQTKVLQGPPLQLTPVC